jgi:hypothetical protein
MHHPTPRGKDFVRQRLLAVAGDVSLPTLAKIPVVLALTRNHPQRQALWDWVYPLLEAA